MSDSARDAGVRALKEGNPKGALQHFAEALQHNPRDAQAHAYMGTTYGQLGMPEKAIECLSRAVELVPQSAPLRYNLGMAQERAGKRDEAVTSYRKAVSLDGSYERARQALTRLGEATMSEAPKTPPAAPLAPPVPMGGAVSAGAPPAGLSDFALGDSAIPTAQKAPPASPYGVPSPGSIYGAPPVAGPTPSAPPVGPTPYGTPPVSSPTGPHTAALPAAGIHGAPPVSASRPAAPLSPPPAPPGYGAPATAAAVPGPDGTVQCPSCAQFSRLGMICEHCSQPLPPPPRPVSTPPPAAETGISAERGDATIRTLQNPERELSRSALLGNCYLAGMGMGLWWGLIGAAIVFLMSLTQVKGSDFGRALPIILVLCLMYLAGGAVAFGVIGMLGGSSDDAESLCGKLGAVFGVVTGLVIMPSAMGAIGYFGLFGLFSCIWVTRRMAQSLGANLNEWQSTVFVVAGAQGVSMMPNRR